MMKTTKLTVFCIEVVLTISACVQSNITPTQTPAPSATPGINLPPPVETVPISTATSNPTEILANTPTTISTTASSSSPGPCINQADFVADITIPDGSILNSDVEFVKTWRVKNTGTCTWNSGYSLLFVDGTLFMPSDQVNLPGTVAPGQTIDLSLNMTSPIYPGPYESDWKLRSPGGILFGVGTSDSPLWVKVVISSPDKTTIMGYVYQDQNGNAVYDNDDVLMANREIWLLQGSCEPSAARLASVVSGSDGRYTLTGPFGGTLCVGLTGANGLEDVSTVSATIGQTLTNIDLRAAPPGATISGVVWDDSLQPDGTWQNSEPFLAGVVVLVQRGPCGSPASVPVSAITDSKGYYSFGDLYSGIHCISIHPDEGNNASIFQVGNWTDPANGTRQITISPGGESTANFGWQYK